MVTWQANTNEQAPALVWFVLSHPWRKYFTSDPLCWTERFLPEEHGVVLYPPNITNHFSNDCSDLCGYKWFVLVCLLSNYSIHMRLFFPKCIVPGQTLTVQLDLYEQKYLLNGESLAGRLAAVNQYSMASLVTWGNHKCSQIPQSSSPVSSYMFSYRTLVELCKSHLGYWTK